MPVWANVAATPATDERSAATPATVSRLRRSPLPDALAIGAVWLLVLVFFWRLVTPDLAIRQYYVTGDFTWKEQAQDTVVARSLAAGQLPLWNPYIYGGQPIAADSGVGIFYPMELLVDGTAGSAGVSILRLEWRVVIDFLLASSLVYLFLRRLTRSVIAALGGTVLFTFSGYLTSYPPHQLDILETGTWLPLALLAAHEVAAGDPSARRRWAVVGGVALGLCFLAGHPQTALLVTDATLAYFVYLLVRRRAWRAAWPDVAITALVALGVSAVQVIPSLEFFPVSNRTSISDAAARAGLAIAGLPGLALPHYADQAALYVGLGAAVLAGIGLWRGWRRDAGFWAGMALVALLLSLGGETPLYPVFAHLGFSLISDQSRAIFLTSFAIAVLASFGLAALLRARWSRPALLLVAAATVAGPPLTLLFHFLGDPLAAATPDASPFLRGGLFVVVAVATLLSWRRGRSVELAALSVIALLAVDGLAVNWNNNLTTQPPALGDGLPGTIAYLRTLPQPFRIATDGDSLIPANDLGNYGLATDQGYNDFRLGAVDQLITSSNLWRAWQLLDVHVFLSTRAFDAPYTLEYSEHGVHTYAISGMLPDVWAVWRYQVIPSSQASLVAVLAPSFDPGQTVTLDRAPDLAVPALPQHAQQITETIQSPERTIVTAQVDHPAILVRSAAYYPGWVVRVDGHAAPLLRADHALQAVAIPAGRHTITFTLDPWSVKIGIAVTLLTLAALAISGGWSVAHRR